MKASKGEAESDVSGVQVSMLSRSSDKSEKLQSFKLHTSNGAGIPRGTRSLGVSWGVQSQSFVYRGPWANEVRKDRVVEVSSRPLDLRL